MSAVAYYIVGSVGFTLSIGGLTVLFWRHAITNHVDQPQELCVKFMNIVLLILLPTLLLGWLVPYWLVNNRQITGSHFDIRVLVPTLFFLNLFCFYPVWLQSNSSSPIQRQHVALFLTITLSMAGFSSMIGEGRVRSGLEPNYKGNSAQVIGWEAINDTFSLIRIESPGDDCNDGADIVTNCTSFDQSLKWFVQEDDEFDDDGGDGPEFTSWIKYNDDREFSCTGGPEYSDDDGTINDWPMAYAISGNTYTCSASWRRLYGEYYGAPEGFEERYQSGPFFGWAAIFACMSIMEYYGWEEVTDLDDDRESPFLGN